MNAIIPDYNTFRYFIITTVVALILLLIGFSVWNSVTEYRLTVHASEQKTRGYARALREHAERALSEADNILLDIIDQTRVHGGIDKENSQHLREILHRRHRAVPQIGSIVLINREGRLFAHTLDTPILESDARDREFFMYHRSHPADNAPFLSKPFKSRLTGKWRFTLSHAVRSPQGVFEGVVAVGFEMEYFQKFYGSLDLGKKGRIVMVRTDGALILAEPFNEKDYSVDFKKSHLILTYLPRSPRGTFKIAAGKALLESDSRIISYDSLESFPLVATTNIGIDEITAPWHKTTILQGALTLSACIGLASLTIVLLRQLKRIQKAYLLQSEQQSEIATAKEHYRLLVDNLPVVIWQVDEQLVIHYISRGVFRIDGYTTEEVQAGGVKLASSRIHPDDHDSVRTAFRSLFTNGTAFDVEYRLQHKDGHWIWIHNFAYATVLVNGIRIAHGMFSDITARKQTEHEKEQLEGQLRQAQKMEAIGHLAGGIAHDFNNLLTPIMGYAEMSAASLSSGDPLAPKLAGIIKAAHKAKTLTQQLLGFGRRQSIVTEVIDLNEVIRSFNNILRSTIRASISIDLVLNPVGSFIKADRIQIEQIILNLTVNAQDAFDGNQGRITIETGTAAIDEESARKNPGMVPGDYVLLSFRDNGCGMSSEIINHIFEPFFTTKQPGHGTGLGLATVYGIVKQHNGYIYVTSKMGEGTVFTIYFPRSIEAPPKLLPIEPVPLNDPAKKAVILVVEDNEMVREMMVELLAGFGFTVRAVADPLEALDQISDGGDPIDLLVSDVVMPGMNGPELYDKLLERIPALKVVFISGYPINPGTRGDSMEEKVHYLQKPFTAEALLERINQVM